MSLRSDLGVAFPCFLSWSCPYPAISELTLTAVNLQSLISGANEQHGNGDQISSLIAGAMGSISNVSPNASVDESKVQANHDEAYNKGNAGSMSANAMGSAAALQAFQSFLSGGGAQQQQGGGGSMIQKLIGMAMGEASKVSSTVEKEGLPSSFVLAFPVTLLSSC